jgi:hypothetical protein
MPLFWSGGFVIGALATMAGGGRLVLQETVEPGAALELLETERCTIMAGWHQAGPLLEHPDFPRRRLTLRKGSFHVLADRLMGPGTCQHVQQARRRPASPARDRDRRRCGARRSGGRPGMDVRIVDRRRGRPPRPASPADLG